MQSLSPRTLTWLTLAAALCSALLLAGEDAGLPDLKQLGDVVSAASIGSAARRAAPAAAHRVREVDPRRRER